MSVLQRCIVKSGLGVLDTKMVRREGLWFRNDVSVAPDGPLCSDVFGDFEGMVTLKD